MTLKGKGYRIWALLLWPCVVPNPLPAQSVTVTGHVTLVAQAKDRRSADNANVVVWLMPQPAAAAVSPSTIAPATAASVPSVASPVGAASSSPASRPAPRYQLLQKNKRFSPHILVVPLGAVVEFPNQDPFFHNVFSMFEGKRFDLGLYEAGTTRTVTFNKPGVSYIFCNIHPEMSAVVIVTSTPYYGISNAEGEIAINGVPAGLYLLNVWTERCQPQTLKAAGHEVMISPQSSSLGELRLMESGDLLAKHKNKYGRDYDRSVAPSLYGVE